MRVTGDGAMLLAGVLAVLAVGGLRAVGGVRRPAAEDRRDRHSYSRADQVRVTALDLELSVDFDRKVLAGAATWTFRREPGCPDGAPLVLDTRGLTIEKIEALDPVPPDEPVTFRLGATDPILGQPLEIDVPTGAERVRVHYRTSTEATALQWVEPAGTAGKRHPFLYTQSQAIHARSWIPCQDTPGVKFVYMASVRLPRESDLEAVMAAEGPFPVAVGNEMDQPRRLGFRMDQPIPSYLIALAVGKLEFRKLGGRTGVWAEPETIDRAAAEFADTERMVEAAERRFGPYRWGRFDLLVLPPSFPYGGMENPRLTFATPTVIAGDRSQVSLIAHELAHSWSGNLVTNATWRDFWLNEGLTVYLERRILDDVYGPERASMERALGYGELRDELAKLPPADQILHVDLTGRDPDEGVTRVPYEKGALFLEGLAETLGRERVDSFLKGYFDHFAGTSLTTADFEAYLRSSLIPEGRPPLDPDAWIREPGLPADAPAPASDRFGAIASQARDWLAGQTPAADLSSSGWSTLEWLHFLRTLPKDLASARLAELDGAYRFTETGNAEIASQWLAMAIRARYSPADAAVERFLKGVGRRKLILPLYEALVTTPEGLARARAIFEGARPGYHPIAATSVAALLERAGRAMP